MPGGEARLSGEPGDAKPKDGAAGAGEDSAGEESDEALLTRIEAEVKAAPARGRRAIINDSRGALRRIADPDTEADPAVKARATALLDRYDLDA